MAQVLRTRSAENDLLEIWVYVAEGSVEAADQVLSTIENKCQNLAASPYLGRQRDELASSLRSIPSGSYVIFYRPIEDGIEIIRVLHGARDASRLFADQADEP